MAEGHDHRSECDEPSDVETIGSTQPRPKFLEGVSWQQRGFGMSVHGANVMRIPGQRKALRVNALSFRKSLSFAHLSAASHLLLVC